MQRITLVGRPIVRPPQDDINEDDEEEEPRVGRVRVTSLVTEHNKGSKSGGIDDHAHIVFLTVIPEVGKWIREHDLKAKESINRTILHESSTANCLPQAGVVAQAGIAPPALARPGKRQKMIGSFFKPKSK